MLRTDSARRGELLDRGFVRFPGVLAPEFLGRIQESARRHVAAVSAEHRAARRSQGCIIGMTVDPLFAELVGYGPALAALVSLGYEAPCFSNGYIISKPPRGPRLYWHQDWYAWEDARSYEPDPPQVALMYYLTETTRYNGCLRVVPGSHLRYNPLHDQIGDPHRIAAVRELEDLDHPAFSDRPDETDVPATPGDLLVVDARMLHAAHIQSVGRGAADADAVVPAGHGLPARAHAGADVREASGPAGRLAGRCQAALDERAGSLRGRRRAPGAPARPPPGSRLTGRQGAQRKA